MADKTLTAVTQASTKFADFTKPCPIFLRDVVPKLGEFTLNFTEDACTILIDGFSFS